MKKYLLVGFCYLFFLGFTGCNDDTDDPGPGPDENTPPVADAGPDIEGNTGSTVTLDGSASSDADEDELTYLWEISTKPEGSNVSINDHTTAVANFIPDEAGTYTITLTVDDGTDSNSDETIVEVEGDPLQTVEVNSHINEDVVWEDIFDNPDLPDYYVTRDIDVNARLTINPGVVVHVAEQAVITIESGGGTLIAEGQEDNKITFTSFDEAGEINWGGILINSSSSQNVLEHVNIAYAGGENFLYASGWRATSVGISSNGRLSFNNVSISLSGRDGLFVDREGNLASFSNNTFSQNSGFSLSLSINQLGIIDDSNSFVDDEETSKKENTVRIYDSKLEEEQEWSALANGARFLFQGDVSVESNLTINEGTILEFEENVEFEVIENGVLVAKGTAAKQIVFTSANVADGKKWAGLYIHSSSINNELDHVQVSHAGSEKSFYSGGWRATNVGVGNGAKLKLTNSEISHSADYGVFIHNTNGAAFEAFSNNHFHDNADYPLYMHVNMAGMMDEATVIEDNTHNVVAVYKSSFTEDAAFIDPTNPQLVALNGDAKYLFTGDLEVEDDMEIAPGAYLAFSDNVLVNVHPGASFKAVGTSGDKIFLTAYERDGNHNWNGLYIESANSNNQIEHAEVSYAGNEKEMYVGGWLQANIGVRADASLEINNAEVSHSKGYGIAVHSNGDLSGVTYSNNALDDLFVK